MQVKLCMCSVEPQHGDDWESGGTAPRILQLGTRSRGMLDWRSSRFVSSDRAVSDHCTGHHEGTRAQLNTTEKGRSSCRVMSRSTYSLSASTWPSHYNDWAITDLLILLEIWNQSRHYWPWMCLCWEKETKIMGIWWADLLEATDMEFG